MELSQIRQIKNTTANKGLALCRRTVTQTLTVEHLASVVLSLTDIAEQQILT